MSLRVLRGTRILQALDEDSTAQQLRQNIEQGFPNTKKRQHATNEVTISNVQYIPYVGTKFLHIKSQSTSNGNQYKQVIQFTKVVFEPADTPDNISFTSVDGRDVHVQPINLAQHNAKVRCNCLDFHYRFATWNFSDNSLVGPAPKPYRRVTTTRPPVNPSKVEGMCKHLIKLVDTLKRGGLVA